MIRHAGVALVVSLGLACLAAPGEAASKDIERLQVQIAALQGQIAELQRATEDTTREVRRLTEVLAEQNALLKKSAQDGKVDADAIQAALKDLGDRLSLIEAQLRSLAPALPAAVPPGAAPGGPAPGGEATASPSPAPASSAPPPAPRELYSQAYADYARGNFDLAAQEFQDYLRYYPNTDFSDNAQYWIGECQYGKQRYQDAVESWKTLMRDYPASDKLPDAHVKTGMALERLGRRSQALLEYRYVVDHYPNSQAARIAREKLSPQ